MDLFANTPQQGLVPGSTGVAGTFPVVKSELLFPEPAATYIQMPSGEWKLNPIQAATPDEIKMMDAAAHIPGMWEYIRNTYPVGAYPDPATARRNAVQDQNVRRSMAVYDTQLAASKTTSANKTAQVSRAYIAKDFLQTYVTQVRRMRDLKLDVNRDGTPRIALDVLSNDARWIDFSQQPLVGDMFGQGGYGIPLYVQEFLGMSPEWQSVRQRAIKGDGAAIIMLANLGSAQNAVRALGDVGNLAVAEQIAVMQSLLPSPKDSRDQALGKVIHFNNMLDTIIGRLNSHNGGEQAVRDVFRSNGQGYIAASRAEADQRYQNVPPLPQMAPANPQDYRFLGSGYNPNPTFLPYEPGSR